MGTRYGIEPLHEINQENNSLQLVGAKLKNTHTHIYINTNHECRATNVIKYEKLYLCLECVPCTSMKFIHLPQIQGVCV